MDIYSSDIGFSYDLGSKNLFQPPKQIILKIYYFPTYLFLFFLFHNYEKKWSLMFVILGHMKRENFIYEYTLLQACSLNSE